jgi:tetrahydromethanopterin S-methyltransferase subunit G
MHEFMEGFMECIYGIFVCICGVFAVISYNLCMVLYDIIKYGFEKESNFVCVILSITILASTINDILIYMQYDEFNSNTKRIQELQKKLYMQYDEFNSNTKRIQELEKKVYHIENKLDGNTRMVTLHLQRVFDDSKQNKEV